MAKKGQAALEFLMTYGWAILVVLVVIGALAYFGVFNTDALVPEKCNLGTGIGCNDYRITSGDATSGNVKLSITNGMGKGITITSAQIVFKGSSGGTLATCTDSTSHSLANGDSLELELGPCNTAALPTSRKAKGTITLVYNYDDSTYTHTQEGELMAKVES